MVRQHDTKRGKIAPKSFTGIFLSNLLTGSICVIFTVLVSPVPKACSQELVFLSDRDYVNRLSMDLKGTRSTVEESGTPSDQIDSLIDEYMQTEEFGNRILWLGNDIFLTRTIYLPYFIFSYDYQDEHARTDVTKAVGEEPIRLFEYIVRNDLPLTELVTADYTISNSTTAWFWDIDYPGPYYGAQWLKSRYKDGREHAGILSQSSFYFRYGDSFTNRARHRANNISRIFVGDDHLLRNVSIDLRLGNADPELDLRDATLHKEGCVACHSTMDGIGSHLLGFNLGPAGQDLFARQNFGTFSYQGVERAQLKTGYSMAYYGYPSRGLKDLGNYIASDPGFARTMATHIYRFFMHRDVDYRDRDLMNGLATTLADSGFSTKALIKAIVKSDEYRAVGVVGGPTKAISIPNPENGMTPAYAWRELEAELASSKDSEEHPAWLATILRSHAIAAGYAERAAPSTRLPVNPDKGTGQVVNPPPAEEVIQPFKLATPEQLHSLGLELTGEMWDYYQGGIRSPGGFPHLEYNEDVKVAAGGYGGDQIIARRWDVPPTYLLVVERWAQVLADDILRRELSQSVPQAQRRVFTIGTGKEDPREAETIARLQIADWFLRFYGETVDPNGPEVDDVFGVLLLAFEELGHHWQIPIAWSHILAMMLSDLRIALY